MHKLVLICLTVACIPSIAIAQSINKEIKSQRGTTMLIGKIDRTGLQSDNYPWFSKNYDQYEPNNAITLNSAELNKYTIKLFLGTWCGDSKKEVPRLYKVLDAASFPMEQLSVVAVHVDSDTYKQSPNHEEVGLNIHRVPTIVFYKDGKEVNRIVEHPIESFEEDIQNIITTNTYTSNYQLVAEVNDILTQKGTKGLSKNTKKLLKKYTGKASSMFELNTYGRVLYAKNQKEEAITVFKLNTKLFPDEPRTYMSLANTLGANGKKNEALAVLKKAIKRHPNNQDLLENLKVVESN